MPFCFDEPFDCAQGGYEWLRRCACNGCHEDAKAGRNTKRKGLRCCAGNEEIESRMTQIGWMNTDRCDAALAMVEPQRHKDTEENKEAPTLNLRAEEGKDCSAALAM